MYKLFGLEISPYTLKIKSYLNYKKIKDSLILIIEKRITDARTKPKGLGPQFADVKNGLNPKP